MDRTACARSATASTGASGDAHRGLGRRSRRFPRGLVRVLHCQCIAHARNVATKRDTPEEVIIKGAVAPESRVQRAPWRALADTPDCRRTANFLVIGYGRPGRNISENEPNEEVGHMVDIFSSVPVPNLEPPTEELKLIGTKP